MKSEDELRQRIAQLEGQIEGQVKHSPAWNRAFGKKQALEWVLRDDENTTDE